MASVDFEGNPSDEAVSDGEEMETQLYLERIVTDTKELEEEQKTKLNQVYNHKLFKSGIRGGCSVCIGKVVMLYLTMKRFDRWPTLMDALPHEGRFLDTFRRFQEKHLFVGFAFHQHSRRSV
jgi:hypothetical protein